MNNSWLESRKDFFLRNMVQDFCIATIYFDQLVEEHKKTGLVAYHLLDAWIGSELKKGPLWNLKDQCHRLFRDNETMNNLYEHLFDWTIGSIFHETIKLKEDAYQLEAYRPLLELDIYRQNETFSVIIDEYLAVIEHAHSNLADELSRIKQLFTKALSHLKAIFPAHRDNLLLIRFLLDNNNKLARKVFGKDYFHAVLSSLFPEGLHHAYLSSAEQCISLGRNQNAVRYLKKVLALDPHNKVAQDLLQKVVQK